MKFVISFLLSIQCYGNKCYASPINIFHEGNSADAGMYRDILKNDYSIPEDLIELKTTNGCETQKTKGKLDLCLKNNGDLYVVSVDRKFIDESLKVFQAP